MGASAPKISIIIVVLNGVKTLENAINSILQQTYTNFEIIVKDGLSTDGTIDILKRYDLNNFYWESAPDKGIYDAMNEAIKKARGEWIYFLGSDDTLYNSEVLLEIFGTERNLDCDFLYGNVYSVSLKKKYDGKFDEKKILFRNISHQSIFYKKSIHEKIGYYDLSYKIFADWHFNIKCFLNAGIKKKYIDIVVANFAAGGISAYNKDVHFIRNFLFRENLEALKGNGIKKMFNIIFYDNWWRLVRNMKLIKGKDNIANYSTGSCLPRSIKRIYFFQKKIPRSVLRLGVFSKIFMLISYCTNVWNFNKDV